MKLTREEILSFTCDDQEKIIARHFNQAGIEHISRFRTFEERQFAFRCFWVPFEIVGVCEEAFLSPKGKVRHIWQFALLTAHGRMLKEMCAWEQDPRVSWWYPHRAAKGCQWWMNRYDAHTRAIDASFAYWMKRKCPDCCHEHQGLAAASRHGFIERVDVEGLPAKWLDEIRPGMKERGQAGSRELEFYHKYANPKGVREPKWKYCDIDLWLIEMWPLVEQYGWTYREVCELAFKKFGGDDALTNASVLSDPEALKKGCKLLNLRLSTVAQQRKGRPKKSGNWMTPVNFEAVYEQVSKRLERPDPQVDSRGRSAYERLAEMAVNIDPFTRLLAGESKESSPVAVPNMKMGGKTSASPYPFFVAPGP